MFHELCHFISKNHSWSFNWGIPRICSNNTNILNQKTGFVWTNISKQWYYLTCRSLLMSITVIIPQMKHSTLFNTTSVKSGRKPHLFSTRLINTCTMCWSIVRDIVGLLEMGLARRSPSVIRADSKLALCSEILISLGSQTEMLLSVRTLFINSVCWVDLTISSLSWKEHGGVGYNWQSSELFMALAEKLEFAHSPLYTDMHVCACVCVSEWVTVCIFWVF